MGGGSHDAFFGLDLAKDAPKAFAIALRGNPVGSAYRSFSEEERLRSKVDDLEKRVHFLEMQAGFGILALPIQAGDQEIRRNKMKELICPICGGDKEILQPDGEMGRCPYCPEEVDLLIREEKVNQVKEDLSDSIREKTDEAFSAFWDDLEEAWDQAIAWQKQAMLLGRELKAVREERNNLKAWSLSFSAMPKSASPSKSTPQWEWLKHCVKKGSTKLDLGGDDE